VLKLFAALSSMLKRFV